jgi:hypothetical protein
MKFVRHKMKLRGRSHPKLVIKRNPMISVGFKRVSKQRPCRICGKTTYCGFSRDEGTSICMRISAGARGLSRNGGNIHVHPEIPFMRIRPRIISRKSQSIPAAPLEIRDAVFQALIRISPASNYMEELVAGPGGLLSRGLLKDDANRYGALPRTKQHRAALAGILNDYVCAHFPEYANFHSGAGVIGVPGFWQELSGMVHIWTLWHDPKRARSSLRTGRKTVP